MCGHVAHRSGIPVRAFDLRQEPLQRLAEQGVTSSTPAEIAANRDVILLSLPGGKAVAKVIEQPATRHSVAVVIMPRT